VRKIDKVPAADVFCPKAGIGIGEFLPLQSCPGGHQPENRAKIINL